MPLEPGKSSKAFSHNVETEMAAGKPQRQAVAIAYSEKERTSDMDYSQVGPKDLTPAKLNEQNRRYWEQPGGQTFANDAHTTDVNKIVKVPVKYTVYTGGLHDYKEVGGERSGRVSFSVHMSPEGKYEGFTYPDMQVVARELGLRSGEKLGKVTWPDYSEVKRLAGFNSATTDEHLGFTKLEHELAHKPGVNDPAAVAASIGREKYGAHGMAEKAAAGRK